MTTGARSADALFQAGLNCLSRRAWTQAAQAFAQTLAAQPKHMPALLTAGQLALQMGDAALAVSLLTRLIKLAPRHTDALNARGAAQLALREPALALLNFEKVAELQPRADFAHANRGLALLAMHRPADALAAFDQALALRPDNAQSHGNRGNALSRLHRWDEAIAAFEAALALQPDLHLARWNIGMTQLRLGQWHSGWQHSEARLDLFAAQGWQAPSAAPRWATGMPLAGRRLLIHSEQGLGDTLQFGRFVPLLQAMGAQVVFEVQAPLQGLISAALPNTEVVARGQPLPPHDLQCPLMSLPLALCTDASGLPPPLAVQPDAARLSHWQTRLGPRDRPRVGVVWSGNPQQSDDIHRSIPLATLLPALHPGIEWISLQQEVRPWDEAAMRSGHLQQVQQVQQLRHFGSELQSFDDTAALCAQMDLVVSVCTSVAHLAGSMGQPLWLLAAHTADWRWLTERADSPWYPSARVFRQAQPGDWSGVLHQVSTALDGMR